MSEREKRLRLKEFINLIEGLHHGKVGVEVMPIYDGVTVDLIALEFRFAENVVTVFSLPESEEIEVRFSSAQDVYDGHTFPNPYRRTHR